MIISEISPAYPVIVVSQGWHQNCHVAMWLPCTVDGDVIFDGHS